MTALGSYGDVYPIVAIGAALRARGHQVTVITNPHFRSLVHAEELEFVALGTEQQYLELTRHPHLWKPLRSLGLVLRLAGTFARPIYDAILERSESGNTVVAAHGLDLGSRIAQEAHGIPMANLHLAPLALRTLHAGPALPYGSLSGGVPRSLKQAAYWTADRLVADPPLLGPVNSLRRELGLAPVHRIYHDWWLSPQLGLALFPDWFAPPQPDWPPPTKCVGFPLWDEGAGDQLPEDADDWLVADDPPIAFTPGSAMTEGRAFFDTAVSVCQRLGRRGLLLSRFDHHVPESLPPTVRHERYLPFSRLLSRVAAVVHHGGIGSCAQGLAGGVPQLVMPMAFDQFDNGARLAKLGVATVVPRRRFSHRTATRALRGLLESDEVQVACRRAAARCAADHCLERSCALMEQLIANSSCQTSQSMS